ncbi:hypothetical protein BGW80DRAFT_1263789 [Lactifluus volemus]|nr:hypothetical protein BGW80DRAFT_1263789 [Lactifluus volemus]
MLRLCMSMHGNSKKGINTNTNPQLHHASVMFFLDFSHQQCSFYPMLPFHEG